jgi:hypothetical protein
MTGIQDRDIAAMLEPLRAATVHVPFPGQWLSPPYTGTDEAVIADDPGLARLLLNRITGAVTYESNEGRRPVNTSLDQFIDCARAYTEALRAAAETDDDTELDRLEQALLSQFASIDFTTRRPEHFWATGAEEIGSGLLATDTPTAPPPKPEPADRPGVLVALTTEESTRFFPRADWLRLADIAEVKLVSAPQRLAATIQALPLIDAQRGRTTPPWRVLVAGAETEDLGARRDDLLPADCTIIDAATATARDVFAALDHSR